MKQFLIIFLSLIMSWSAQAQKQNTLIAKCGFPPIFGGTKTESLIRPGTPFIYVFKQGQRFFVVNSIAHREDDLKQRTTPLLGELPLIPTKPGMGLSWDQPDFTGVGSFDINSIGMNLENPQPVNELFVSSGLSSFTEHAYPTCFMWK